MDRNMLDRFLGFIHYYLMNLIDLEKLALNFLIQLIKDIIHDFIDIIITYMAGD
jgi:hypothetical protein